MKNSACGGIQGTPYILYDTGRQPIEKDAVIDRDSLQASEDHLLKANMSSRQTAEGW